MTWIRTPPQSNQQGFFYIMAMFFVVLIGISLMMIGQQWSVTMKRDREAERKIGEDIHGRVCLTCQPPWERYQAEAERKVLKQRLQELRGKKTEQTERLSGLRQTHHIFCGSKAPWHEITDGLPQFDEYPPASFRP